MLPTVLVKSRKFLHNILKRDFCQLQKAKHICLLLMLETPVFSPCMCHVCVHIYLSSTCLCVVVTQYIFLSVPKNPLPNEYNNVIAYYVPQCINNNSAHATMNHDNDLVWQSLVMNSNYRDWQRYYGQNFIDHC